MGFSRAVPEETEQESKLLGTTIMAIDNPFQAQDQQLQQTHQFQDYNHQISYGVMQYSPSSSSTVRSDLISKNSGAYDLGELDQALFLYLDGQDASMTVQDQRQMRPSTLNIFPSQPMHVRQTSAKAQVGLVSPATRGSKRSSEQSTESSNPEDDIASGNEPAKAIKCEGNRKSPTLGSGQEKPKTTDAKTLRRLAQNREAARKSRLRKKAYVQQLESSRIRLAQLEQELQRARAQGVLFGGSHLSGREQVLPIGNVSSDAAAFDMAYARWVEEEQQLMCELRAAVQEQLPENELRLFVDNCLAHYDEMLKLKSMVAKSDVFYLISGQWRTPAERCFLWMGDFRPSHLIKIIVNEMEELTQQQMLGICELQQWTHEAEEAVSQGLGALHQSVSQTITSDALSCPPNMPNYMSLMALAIKKLSTLEPFFKQADNLRHQMIHRLNQILTVRQAARCFLAVGEYFHRLRALSSLWLLRPRQE